MPGEGAADLFVKAAMSVAARRSGLTCTASVTGNVVDFRASTSDTSLRAEAFDEDHFDVARWNAACGIHGRRRRISFEASMKQVEDYLDEAETAY